MSGEYVKTSIIRGGTKVIPNPTLVGTEPELEGLQIGETKYKVAQGVVPDYPVTDVKVEGVSVVSNKTANVTLSALGITSEDIELTEVES